MLLLVITCFDLSYFTLPASTLIKLNALPVHTQAQVYKNTFVGDFFYRWNLRLKIGEGPGGDRERLDGNPGKTPGKKGSADDGKCL